MQLTEPERIYNPITTMQWGFRQCLPFSWTTLRGKHCQHPIAVMGVVDTFGLSPDFKFGVKHRPKTIVKSHNPNKERLFLMRFPNCNSYDQEKKCIYLQ
jgi:hypothetical protein